MNKKLLLSALFLAQSFNLSFAQNEEIPTKKVFITVDNETGAFLSQKFNSRLTTHKSVGELSLMEIDEEALPWISSMMHEKFNRCGGFMVHEEYGEAVSFLNPMIHKSVSLADYKINQDSLVRSMTSKVDEANLRETIQKLSSYKNRYYQSPTGVASQNWIKSNWESLLAGRNDVEVSLFQHKSWDQPSVIAKITGSKTPDEAIVIGGHADSIAGFWGGARAEAPGADDNASGIATITEVIRILGESSYQPEKTIYFMAYAAEEVGLRGSKEIASSFRSKGVNVIGVIQLDMTNFNGSNDTIALISDNTNEQQNAFLGKIIDRYVEGLNWTYDKCGYACSDHASWTAQGYPASMPFEARKKQMNSSIHTSRDTISRSQGTADHASKFSQMVLAYLVELDK